MQKYFGFIKKFFSFFRKQGDSERTLMEKLRDKYRLVIMNDATFEEVTSLKLTPLSVYVGLSTLIVGTAFLVTMLIIFTPLKRYIPGYGDYTRDAEISELTSKVASLQEEVDASRLYTENFRKMLNGNMEDISKDAVEKQTPKEVKDSSNIGEAQDIDRIPEDEQLRQAVARGSFSGDASPSTGNANSTNIVLRDIPLEQMFFVPPVSGEVMSNFDLKKSHFGIDVAAPKNTAVKSSGDGVVISAGYTVETGYSIAIQHPNNVITMYKHNSVLLKKEGSSIKAGEAIAIIGNSGEQSSGPHLHFELWYKGRPVDPTDYINFN